MMRVRKSAIIAQVNGIRSRCRVHGFSFLKLKKIELQIYNLVIINITI